MDSSVETTSTVTSASPTEAVNSAEATCSTDTSNVTGSTGLSDAAGSCDTADSRNAVGSSDSAGSNNAVGSSDTAGSSNLAGPSDAAVSNEAAGSSNAASSCYAADSGYVASSSNAASHSYEAGSSVASDPYKPTGSTDAADSTKVSSPTEATGSTNAADFSNKSPELNYASASGDAIGATGPFESFDSTGSVDATGYIGASDATDTASEKNNQQSRRVRNRASKQPSRLEDIKVNQVSVDSQGTDSLGDPPEISLDGPPEESPIYDPVAWRRLKKRVFDSDSESISDLQGLPIYHFNVGGDIYVAMTSALANYPESVFGDMLRYDNPDEPETTSALYFIDRDGTLFRHVIDFMRDGVLLLPPNFVNYEGLRREARMYRLDALVNEIDRQEEAAMNRLPPGIAEIRDHLVAAADKAAAAAASCAKAAKMVATARNEVGQDFTKGFFVEVVSYDAVKSGVHTLITGAEAFMSQFEEAKRSEGGGFEVGLNKCKAETAFCELGCALLHSSITKDKDDFNVHKTSWYVPLESACEVVELLSRHSVH